MSYDWDETQTVVPTKKLTLRERLVNRYWDAVVWCALDAPLGIVNRWGLARLLGRRSE